MSEDAVPAPARGPWREAPAWWARSPPRVGVSSCLLGEPVRFNGGHKRDRFLTTALGAYVEWLPVCPEVEVGMGTPRETLRLEERLEERLEDADGGPRMVTASGTRDHTREMRDFAERRVRELDEARLCGYVLKSKSPSCGLSALPVYAGGQVRHRHGRGLYAAALAAARPLLAIEEEGRLAEPGPRGSFVERVFAHARLRELFDGDWRQRDLVDFHARHKLQLMAHAPGRAKEAGRLAAGRRPADTAAGERPADEVEDAYTRAFLAALAAPATRGRHVNALQHAAGLLGDRLDTPRRQEVDSAITAYRDGRLPRSAPAALLRDHARARGPDLLRAQTYFDPFPAELAPHDHPAGPGGADGPATPDRRPQPEPGVSRPSP